MDSNPTHQHSRLAAFIFDWGFWLYLAFGLSTLVTGATFAGVAAFDDNSIMQEVASSVFWSIMPMALTFLGTCIALWRRHALAVILSWIAMVAFVRDTVHPEGIVAYFAVPYEKGVFDLVLDVAVRVGSVILPVLITIVWLTGGFTRRNSGAAQ